MIKLFFQFLAKYKSQTGRRLNRLAYKLPHNGVSVWFMITRIVFSSAHMWISRRRKSSLLFLHLLSQLCNQKLLFIWLCVLQFFSIVSRISKKIKFHSSPRDIYCFWHKSGNRRSKKSFFHSLGTWVFARYFARCTLSDNIFHYISRQLKKFSFIWHFFCADENKKL